MSERVYLSSPHMGGEEIKYIHQAFEKNWIAPLGGNVDGFEVDLASYTGRRHAGVFTSGTASIHLGLILLDVKLGDEVICQSFTFAATVNPVRYQGAVPVFVGSETDTWNMDPVLLEEAIQERIKQGKKPKAIIVVHLYGMPAKMDEILAIASEYNIPVLEDAAEALGSKYQGNKCGSFGDFSVLSFNGNKIITTSGGGALLANDEKIIQRARFLSTQARDHAPHYQHSEIGYNYRMSNIVAGIGRGQMNVLEERVEARRQNHENYFRALGGTWLDLGRQHSTSLKTAIAHNEQSSFRNRNSSPTGIYFLREPEGMKSNRWLTTIVINPEETGGVTSRDLQLALETENIESRPLWKPMHLQPVFREFPVYTNGLSEWLFGYGLCLPSGSNLKAEDHARTCGIILQTLENG